MTTAPHEQKGKRKPRHLVIFAVTAIITLILGGSAYVFFSPSLLYNALDKVITQKGLGGGSGIPVNTLYTVPRLASPTTTKSSVLIDGTNHDTLYTVGLLDLSKHPELLHVPDVADRYYSIELVNPSNGDVIGYVGRRTTGTAAGTFLITGPDFHGSPPAETREIKSTNNSVLVVGRVLVESDSDLPTANMLAKQVHLTPFSG